MRKYSNYKLNENTTNKSTNYVLPLCNVEYANGSKIILKK